MHGLNQVRLVARGGGTEIRRVGVKKEGVNRFNGYGNRDRPDTAKRRMVNMDETPDSEHPSRKGVNRTVVCFDRD